MVSVREPTRLTSVAKVRAKLLNHERAVDKC
jgi:hypothetical protein